MAHITISEQDRREYFTVGGTPSTGPFNFTFTFFDADEIALYDDGELVDAADYTLTPNTDYEGGYNGGSITLDSAISNSTVAVARNTLLTRDSDFPTTGSFNITTLNTTLDRIFVALQDMEDRIARSIRLADADETESLELPSDPDDRALGYLAFNSTGTAIISNGTVPGEVATSVYGEAIVGAASYATMRALLDLEVGVDLQAYDADTLKSDVAATLTKGYTATAYDAGTKSTGTFTPDVANGNLQKAVNGGAHTLAPPANGSSLVIQYTNNGSAGTVTTSGFTKVTGDTISTTNADDFLFYITVINGFSHLHVQALQ